MARQIAKNVLLRPLIICGPSGAGKSTLINRFLLRDSIFGPHFGFSVSHTTRKPRIGEVDGVHYHFVKTVEEMDALETRSNHTQPFFVERANVHGNMYGTSTEAVHAVQRQGLICLLDIDIQGVRSIKQAGHLAVNSFFMTPPLGLLEARLRGRDSETESSIRLRLKNAERELEEAKSSDFMLFDHVLLADTTEDMYHHLRPLLKTWYPQIANRMGEP